MGSRMMKRNVVVRMLALTSMLAALVGCGSSGSSTRPDEEAPTGFAPTPYTSKEIRDALVVGTRIDLRVEEGREVTERQMEITAADAEGCTIATKVFDDKGKLVEDQGTKVFTWNELRDHAKFPSDKVVRTEGRITVPVGEHDAWLYVVTSLDGDGKEVETYMHFAKDLPGPPVRMVVQVDGKVVSNWTMVGRR